MTTIGQRAPTTEAQAYAQRIAELEQRLADVERHLANPAPKYGNAITATNDQDTGAGGLGAGVYVRPHPTATIEGGQVQLKGAAALDNVSIDNYNNAIRLIVGNSVPIYATETIADIDAATFRVNGTNYAESGIEQTTVGVINAAVSGTALVMASMNVASKAYDRAAIIDARILTSGLVTATYVDLSIAVAGAGVATHRQYGARMPQTVTLSAPAYLAKNTAYLIEFIITANAAGTFTNAGGGTARWGQLNTTWWRRGT